MKRYISLNISTCPNAVTRIRKSEIMSVLYLADDSLKEIYIKPSPWHSQTIGTESQGNFDQIFRILWGRSENLSSTMSFQAT